MWMIYGVLDCGYEARQGSLLIPPSYECSLLLPKISGGIKFKLPEHCKDYLKM